MKEAGNDRAQGALPVPLPLAAFGALRSGPVPAGHNDEHSSNRRDAHIACHDVFLQSAMCSHGVFISHAQSDQRLGGSQIVTMRRLPVRPLAARARPQDFFRTLRSVMHILLRIRWCVACDLRSIILFAYHSAF
jgi:hypothetical protein